MKRLGLLLERESAQFLNEAPTEVATRWLDHRPSLSVPGGSRGQAGRETDRSGREASPSPSRRRPVYYAARTRPRSVSATRRAGLSRRGHHTFVSTTPARTGLTVPF